MDFVDFRVFLGYGGSRSYAARKNLEALAAASEPVSIRIPVEALLPARGGKYRYKRIGSYIVHCHTPAAVKHLQAAVWKLLCSLDRAHLVDEHGRRLSAIGSAHAGDSGEAIPR